MSKESCKACGGAVEKEGKLYCDNCTHEAKVILDRPTKEESQQKAIVKREIQTVAIMPDATNLSIISKGLAKSGMFPGIKDEFQAMAVVEYGRELGIKPVIALQTIVPIQGRLSVESKVFLALLEMNGTSVEIMEKTKKGSKLKFSKKGKKPFTETFLFTDAEAIQYYNNKQAAWVSLSTKHNWKSYPEEMCFWRCVSKGARAYDPMAVLGLITKEEMLDGAYDGAEDEEEKGKTQINVPAGIKEKEPVKELPKEKPIENFEHSPSDSKEAPVKEEKKPKEEKPDVKKEHPTPEEVIKAVDKEIEEGTAAEDDTAKGNVDIKEEEKPQEESADKATVDACVQALQKDFQIRFGPEKWRKQYQSFKQFLLEFQKGKDKVWVKANEHQKLSLSLGRTKDLQLIIDNISWVLGKWKQWEKKEKEDDNVPF